LHNVIADRPRLSLDRRAVLGGVLASAASAPARAQAAIRLSAKRPPPAARKFVSLAVERRLQAVSAMIADPDLAWLFENCWPNTLDTAVELGGTQTQPDAFVATGDIPAMWLRDSSAQLWSYLDVARDDPQLCLLMRGLIARHARCVLIDPYANAFSRDPAVKSPLPWAAADQTEMKAGVAERKWEVDSLAHVVRFACGYWRATGDRVPFGPDWWQAMQTVVDTFRAQQRLTAPGPYRFLRESDSPNDTLAGDGWGVPTRKIGLIHTMFRPSDDACVYPYNIPANFLAAQSLGELAALARGFADRAEFAGQCDALAGQIRQVLAQYAHVDSPAGGRILAYEIDGFGNALAMDDANIPGLLSLPYLGCVSHGDPVWQATRAHVLSADDPYFFRGKVAEGIGGPHVGPGMIWPMGIIMRAMTSRDDREITDCLAALKRSSAGTGFMHEAFDANDAGHFTRPWFAWVNGLFGELILALAAQRPHLLANPLHA
jgi:meiotically up-regulated gene 157 (Mug157) protein